MITRIQSKTTIMWNLRRKHKVEICNLEGKKLKTIWLRKDGSNSSKIDKVLEKLK